MAIMLLVMGSTISPACSQAASDNSGRSGNYQNYNNDEYNYGNRNNYGIFKPGGVRRDLKDEDIPFIKKTLDEVAPAVQMFKGAVMDDPVIQAIATTHHKSPAQILLRWQFQQGKTVTIPKSSSHARLEENIAIFDFALSESEMKQIFALHRPDGRMIKPPFAPQWDQ